MESGANGIAGNLDSAGDSADNVPLIGDALSKPLTAAGGFARDIAGAGAQLNSTATWLAWLLALAVAAPPILAIAMPWLVLRVRFFRRKWMALTLARTPAGEQLLALRALANRPLAKLAAINVDPVGAWRREDADGDPRPGRARAAIGRRRPPRPPAISDFGVISIAQRHVFTPKSQRREPRWRRDRRLLCVLDDFLREHDGVITLAQARRAGLSEHAVIRRVSGLAAGDGARPASTSSTTDRSPTLHAFVRRCGATASRPRRAGSRRRGGTA